MKKVNLDEVVLIEKSFIFNENISTTAKFLYIVLLSSTNQKNIAESPTRKELLKILNCSEPSLTKYLNELAQNNLVEISKNKIEGEKFLKNTYLIKEYYATKKNKHGEIKDSSMLTFFDTKNVSSKLINNILINKINLLIINKSKNSSSLTSLLEKFESKLGEEELSRVLNHIISKNKQFYYEKNLEAYLNKVVEKSKDSKKEQSKRLNSNTPGWM